MFRFQVGMGWLRACEAAESAFRAAGITDKLRILNRELVVIGEEAARILRVTLQSHYIPFSELPAKEV